MSLIQTTFSYIAMAGHLILPVRTAVAIFAKELFAYTVAVKEGWAG